MTAFSPMPRFFLNREMVMNKRKKDKKMNDEKTGQIDVWKKIFLNNQNTKLTVCYINNHYSNNKY
jgi:hypothetical protein